MRSISMPDLQEGTRGLAVFFCAPYGVFLPCVCVPHRAAKGSVIPGPGSGFISLAVSALITRQSRSASAPRANLVLTCHEQISIHIVRGRKWDVR